MSKLEFPNETKGFVINSFGDPSVGIMSNSVEIKGRNSEVFDFQTKKEFIYFIKDLYNTFSNYFGEIISIYFIEDIENHNENENYYSKDLIKFLNIK